MDVPEDVSDSEGDWVRLGVTEPVRDCVRVRDNVCEAVPVAERVSVAEAVRVSDAVWDRVEL